MAGPACEILIETDDGPVLDEIDAVLSALAGKIIRTRKGRVWDVWIDDRPIHVLVAGSPPTIELSAGCNGREDYEVLRRLSRALVERIGGIATPPEK